MIHRHDDDDACPGCGLLYDRFRGPIDWTDAVECVRAYVRAARERNDYSVRMSEGAVLREMRRAKLSAWDYHIEYCYVEGSEMAPNELDARPDNWEELSPPHRAWWTRRYRQASMDPAEVSKRYTAAALKSWATRRRRAAEKQRAPGSPPDYNGPTDTTTTEVPF